MTSANIRLRKSIIFLDDDMEALTDVILTQEHIAGYCYTQLTDVEQEQNGIYKYDRSEKFDMDRVAAILGKNPDWFGQA